MVKNACVGDYIFFREPSFHIESGKMKSQKVHSLVTNKEGLGGNSGCIKESQLNSVGRWAHPIWAESELERHEVRYMLDNSKKRTYT